MMQIYKVYITFDWMNCAMILPLLYWILLFSATFVCSAHISLYCLNIVGKLHTHTQFKNKIWFELQKKKDT
jgi:hypothetical protein